jgi:hypothetical protein
MSRSPFLGFPQSTRAEKTSGLSRKFSGKILCVGINQPCAAFETSKAAQGSDEKKSRNNGRFSANGQIEIIEIDGWMEDEI